MDADTKNGFITELNRVIEVQNTANLEDKMNNKVHDSNEVEEEEPEKMFAAQHHGKKEKGRRNKIISFLFSAAVLHITLGVLVMVLNVIFIYDGMNSGWYYFKDSLGTELKVISIGEGILAGVSFIIIGSVALYVLTKKGCSKTFLYSIYITMILLSFTLIVTTACQIGLIHQYVPVKDLSSPNQQSQMDMLLKEEARQTAVVAVQMVTYFIVFVSSMVSVLFVPVI